MPKPRPVLATPLDANSAIFIVSFFDILDSYPALIFAKIKPRAQGAGREFIGHLAGKIFLIFVK
jgi:hypothetical protein